MKDLLKQHCYAKGSYSLSQVQTKKISEFVVIAFLSKRKSMVQLLLQLSSFMPLSVLRPTTIPQTQPKPTITQEIQNPICPLLLKALSPLMITTLPTMNRPTSQIDYSILITIQVLHTIIQFALTAIRTIRLHAAISMLEALSTNYLNFNR